MKVYILSYEIEAGETLYTKATKREKRVEHYEESDRQRWISEYFRMKESYYIHNLKAYASNDVPEMSEHDMKLMNEGI